MKIQNENTHTEHQITTPSLHRKPPITFRSDNETIRHIKTTTKTKHQTTFPPNATVTHKIRSDARAFRAHTSNFPVRRIPGLLYTTSIRPRDIIRVIRDIIIVAGPLDPKAAALSGWWAGIEPSGSLADVIAVVVRANKAFIFVVWKFSREVCEGFGSEGWVLLRVCFILCGEWLRNWKCGFGNFVFGFMREYPGEWIGYGKELGAFSSRN